MTKRVSFLIDGFNLYHSIDAAMRDRIISTGKWLDIWSLCKNHVYLFGKEAVLYEIYYFSAIATHLSSPEAVHNHQIYLSALRSTGIQPILGTFKKKKILCRAICKKEGWGYEEKETDVNIAVKLIELLMLESCDIPVIISGDTDLSAAIKSAKRLFPQAKIAVGFPYRRAHAELQQIVDLSFKIRPQTYQKFVFPDQVVLHDGKTVIKPIGW